MSRLPSHLAGTSAAGLSSGHPVAQFEVGSQRNFVYLILDWETREAAAREAAVIDPQRDLSPLLAALAEAGSFSLRTVFLTHTHGDHTAGVPELLRLFPDMQLVVHAKDVGRLPREVRHHRGIHLLEHDESFRVGALDVHAIPTPGHSAGECSYLLETGQGYLFTGDTLFIRDCGRTDLESGSNAEMFESLQRIRALHSKYPELVILPGHHYAAECASLLEDELKRSPPFQCRTEEELAALP